MSHLSAAARARTGLLRPLRAPLCALTLATLLAACAMPTHPDSAAPAPDPYNPAAVQLLDDTSWELTSWVNADGTPRAIPHGDNGEPIKLALSTDSGIRRASGFSGCNRYMGTYAIKNDVSTHAANCRQPMPVSHGRPAKNSTTIATGVPTGPSTWAKPAENA